jgi:hypothetical protein
MGIFIQLAFEENNKTSPEHAKVVLPLTAENLLNA